MKKVKQKSWRRRIQEFFEVPSSTVLKCLIIFLLALHWYDYHSYRTKQELIEDTISSVVIVGCHNTKGNKAGSVSAGFVAADYGYIVTAAHSVRECWEFEDTEVNVVYYEDGWIKRRAAIVAYNAQLDLAIVQVPNYLPIQPLPINVDTAYSQGDEVIAIGHPYMNYWSVSEGIVSADRYWRHPYKRVVQSSAPISPGNSGGPLLNKKGEVIGIVSYSSGGRESLGFMIPGEIIQTMLNGLQ